LGFRLGGIFFYTKSEEKNLSEITEGVCLSVVCSVFQREASGYLFSPKSPLPRICDDADYSLFLS
jgi:hypothetical protein